MLKGVSANPNIMLKNVPHFQFAHNVVENQTLLPDDKFLWPLEQFESRLARLERRDILRINNTFLFLG